MVLTIEKRGIKLFIACIIFLVTNNVLCFKSYAQEANSFVFKGNLQSSTDDMLYLIRFRDGKQIVTDSTMVQNGNFRLEGTCESPEYVLFRLGKGISRHYFLEPGEFILVEPKSNLAKGQIAGSRSNDLYQLLTAEQDKNRRADEIETKIFNEAYARDPKASQPVLDELKRFRNKQTNEFKKLLFQHADNAAAQFIYATHYGEEGDLKEIESFISAAKGANSIYLQTLQDRVGFYQGIAVGSEAPDFVLPDINGTPQQLSKYRGQYVLLDFWASWCTPCRKENPNVVKAYERFKDKGFTVIAVSLDDKLPAWKKAIELDGLPWHHWGDLIGWQSPVVKQYNVRGVPFSLLLDPNGIILAKDLKGENLHIKLEQELIKAK
ncbi:TlpA disulfide reductase family protein [Sphingobacterium faecale]|uniref:TlpA disulfide reductase family protein n=1 Tax=Sphingobacterium faecale TaxID=2803775 RepID=UPI0019245D5E|nr:TlpA disulfide reductase family protein [Sphingobacterium faecale]